MVFYEFEGFILLTFDNVEIDTQQDALKNQLDLLFDNQYILEY
jgi:hypothetical protein